MIEVLPIYNKPLPSAKEPTISEEFWDIAKDKFENKKYKESIVAVINYLNKDILKGVNTNKDIHITQMHGTIELKIDITDSEFKIYVPLLKIDKNTNSIALLRRVAEVNFSYFDLAYIKLRDNILEISYSEKLELCKPIKIHNLIKDISFLSDEYVNEFIDKYGAKLYKEPNVKRLTQKEEDSVYSEIKRILKEYKDYSKEFKEKEKNGYRWDMGVISLLKISNMPYLNGHIRYELINRIRTMYNGDLNFDYRIQKGQEYLEELDKLSKEEITEHLFHPQWFVSMLFISSPDIIKDRLENRIETLQKYERDENKFATAYYLESIFLKLIYNYNLDKNYKKSIEKTLEKVSKQNTQDAAPTLVKLFNKMYNKELKSGGIADIYNMVGDYLFKFSATIFFLIIIFSIIQGLIK